MCRAAGAIRRRLRHQAPAAHHVVGPEPAHLPQGKRAPAARAGSLYRYQRVGGHRPAVAEGAVRGKVRRYRVPHLGAARLVAAENSGERVGGVGGEFVAQPHNSVFHGLQHVAVELVVVVHEKAVAVDVDDQQAALTHDGDVVLAALHGEPALPGVGVDQPVGVAEFLLQGAHPLDYRGEVAPLQLLPQESRLVGAQVGERLKDADLLAAGVAQREVAVGVAERKRAEGVDARVVLAAFAAGHGQRQEPALGYGKPQRCRGQQSHLGSVLGSVPGGVPGGLGRVAVSVGARLGFAHRRVPIPITARASCCLRTSRL